LYNTFKTRQTFMWWSNITLFCIKYKQKRILAVFFLATFTF
jgi:hypothetical protein